MKKIRYAVVGAGSISQKAFMPAVAQTKNSVMTAIVSGNQEAADQLAKFYGIEQVFSYQQYDAALASGIFDAVYIALPNSLHCEYTTRAFERGVHAMVEKPLAVDVAECEAMIAAAAANSTKLMTAYRLHCEPVTVEVFDRIRKGAIGKPRFFEAVFSIQMPSSNHRLKSEHWGGPLQDIGVYCLNAARHVFNSEPSEVMAMKTHGSDPRFSEVEETFVAMLKFPSDAIATFTASFNAEEVDRYRIVGTDGEIKVDPGFRYETPLQMSLRNGAKVSPKKFLPVDHFGAQIAYFSDCILHDQEVGPDGKEGLADVRVMRAIEEAAKAGQVQKIQAPARSYRPTNVQVRMIKRPVRRLVL